MLEVPPCGWIELKTNKLALDRIVKKKPKQKESMYREEQFDLFNFLPETDNTKIKFQK